MNGVTQSCVGAKQRRMVSSMLWPVYSWGKCSWYPLYRSLVGSPRASLDVLEWEKSDIPIGIKL